MDKSKTMYGPQATYKAVEKDSFIMVLFYQCILILLCLAGYYHALNGSFVFDDTVAIVKNADVSTRHTNWTALLRNDFWGTPLVSVDSHKSYRPLTTLLFHLEYGRLGLRAKHMKIINLALHCVNTMLVWWLLREFRFEFTNHTQVATMAAALFAIHPVHTEAVCGVVGRAELLFCLLYLIALLLTLQRSDLGSLTDVLIVILTAVGIFFKETAITIPLACFLLDYTREQIFRHPWRTQLRHVCSPRNFILAICNIALMIFRLWLQDFQSPRFKPMDNPIAFNEDPLTRILSQNYLYVINWWILLCPQWLSFDWALGCIELIENVWDLRLQAVLAMYSLIIVACINSKTNFAPVFGLALMVIPFLPASGIIQVGFVIAERVLYVPSIGFCFLVAQALSYIYISNSKPWFMSIFKWMVMLLYACLLLRTRERSTQWLSEDRLFTSALKVCPNNAKVHYNIARLATDRFDRDKALIHYHKAIKLYPQYESALMNLGNIYREMGELTVAEKYIAAALEVLPDFAAAWMNLGIVQSARKDYNNALKSYQNALKYRKNYAICHYNLGNLYLDMKKHSEAMRHWEEAVALNPRQPKAWANILTLLDNWVLYEDAIRLSSQALNHLPNETNIMFIRANVFGKLQRYVQAEELYKRVIEAEPLNVLFHTNLGVLYHRWDKLNAAIECYQNALKLSPENAITARENLSKLLRRKRKEKAGG
ncbi:PREDICTED: transmembrane and TPR repeat-containing protein CG5038 isoform X1 [Rhagoletis zephyria]|uniref:transmembrane and TPR repeat-containing protein CG5038 isoform X1 n=1 Tax=Rhagoletis zephyria TaxID=28612 RepID=UPI0008113C3E|nr:PREDICTED: transmembrane and TPR repeat-containing protein CG5038 isoform X1 [Rhagoletis zephyria]